MDSDSSESNNESNKSTDNQSLIKGNSKKDSEIDESDKSKKSNENQPKTDLNFSIQRLSSNESNETGFKTACRNYFYRYILFGCLKIQLPSDD